MLDIIKNCIKIEQHINNFKKITIYNKSSYNKCLYDKYKLSFLIYYLNNIGYITGLIFIFDDYYDIHVYKKYNGEGFLQFYFDDLFLINDILYVTMNKTDRIMLNRRIKLKKMFHN